MLAKYICFDEVSRMITENNGEKKYPTKHLDNRVNLYPPNLFQQALHFIIKDRYKKHMTLH